jgi:predicted amidophosphoribosyltransferase
MTQYTCPNCRGGFEELENGCCPWCSTAMDGEYEREPMVSRVKKGDGDENNTLLQDLLS